MKKYNFSPEVWELLKKSGWHEGRDVKDSLEIPLEEFPNYPPFALNFLYEFGGLKINGSKNNIASVGINFSPNRAIYENLEDGTFSYFSKLVKTQLYPIGKTFESEYLAIDSKGNIYTLGDYCIWLATNLDEAIEKLLLGDFSQWKQLDEDTGEWLNNK